MTTLDTGRFQFISDALNGEGVFRPRITHDSDGIAATVDASSTCLIRYPRESEEKFAKRNEVAWYENHLRSACARFTGYIAKKPPLRLISNAMLAKIEDDADWRGNALDIFWQSFMVDFRARGTMLLLIDMPRSLPTTEGEQIEMRAIPYLVALYPEHVHAYDLGVDGLLSKIEIYATGDDGKRLIRGWDRSRWWIRDSEREIDGADHGLGQCPVLYITEGAHFGAVGNFAQIADMSKRLFNARSELDEILRAQTFSLLSYQVLPEQSASFDARSVAETIGTSNMLIHQGQQPAFIAPPDGPATIYLDVIERIEEAIERVAMSAESPEKKGSESGVALNIRFQVLNSSLTSVARKMEDLERRMWAIASRWLRLSDAAAAQIEWPKDFAISDTRAEMEILGAMQTQGFPQEAVRLKQKQIAALEFATSEQDDVDAIMAAIDEVAAEFVE